MLTSIQSQFMLTTFTDLDMHAGIHMHCSFYDAKMYSRCHTMVIFAWAIMKEISIFTENGSATHNTNLLFLSDPILPPILNIPKQRHFLSNIQYVCSFIIAHRQ